MGFQKISTLSLTDLFVQQIENMIFSGELEVGNSFRQQESFPQKWV